jgi:hypothetical protein
MFTPREAVVGSDLRNPFEHVASSPLLSRKPAQLLLTLSLCLILIDASDVRANLVVNGDFEAGNSGFNTDYHYGSTIYNFQQYTITTDPQLAHNQATSYGDHTSGSGLMMAVNGPLHSDDLTVWSQSVAVQPGTNYLLSSWVSSWTSYPPELDALLDFSINGQSLGLFRAPSPAAIWAEFSSPWSSGSDTGALIRIVVKNPGEFIANDFALDDISMTASVPEPSNWLLFSTGLLAAGSYRRVLRPRTV